MHIRFLSASAAVLCVLATSVCRASDWPQWRGPNLNGSAEVSGLPDTLDVNKNLAWKVELPGIGSATPVVAGDRLFVSCWDQQSQKLFGVCLSRTDGHVLWQREIGTGDMQKDRNNPASPSPVTDGKSVFFYYATGDLVALDIEGKPLWHRNIVEDYGKFNYNWIYSSSPMLYKGKLYVQVLHRDVPGRTDSYLLAIDPATGKNLWRQVRPNDAVQETKEAYSTPMPLEFGGRSEIIVVGGDCVTAHDSETGKEIWRAGGWDPSKKQDWRLVPSVTVDPKDGLIFACAPKNGPVMAIKDGGQGDVTATGFAWKSTTFTSDVCVPLFYKDRLYVLDGDKKTLTCVDPKTGEKNWAGSLGGSAVFRASPTGADNKIYCMNENGDIWVLAADQFKVLSKTAIGGRQVRAGILALDGLAIVRSGESLYAFKR